MPVAIFDMDGVLYRGSIVMPHARETLDRLRRAGWQIFFATNNSTATRDDYVRRLASLGLGGDVEHVVTSAYATAHYLERLAPKPKDVFVIGANGLREEIRAVGVSVRDAESLPGAHPPSDAAADGVSPGAMRRYLTSLTLPPPADTVVIGLDLHFTYAKLAEAQRAILAGARFVCSNRDRAYPVEGRLLPGAGSIVAAHRVGATGVLILTGLTEEASLHDAKGEAAPDHVIRSLEELFAIPELAAV